MKLVSNYSKISQPLFIVTYIFVILAIFLLVLGLFFQNSFLTIAISIFSFNAILLTYLSLKNIDSFYEDIKLKNNEMIRNLNVWNLTLSEEDKEKIITPTESWLKINSKFYFLNFIIDDGIICYKGEKVFDITKDTSLVVDYHKIELQKSGDYSFAQILYPGLTVDLLFKNKTLESYKSKNCLNLIPNESYSWDNKKIQQLNFKDNSQQAVFSFNQPS